MPTTVYDLCMAPMEALWIGSLRRWLIPKAKGKVLEVGAGTGVNLPYYQMDQIQQFVLTDRKGKTPDFQRVIQARTRETIRSLEEKTDVRLSYSQIQCQEAEAESLPFLSGQFDTVVATLLLCSVENPRRAIQEIHRVLQAGGQFLFIEHVRPSTSAMAYLFDKVTPAWRRIASGCHLNRDTLKTIEEGGFSILERKHPKDGVFVGGVARKD